MDFLPHERDRDQIQVCAEQALRSDMPSSDEPAGSRHVHLRGSHSISIKVEIFMVSFLDFDSSTHHLIGIRESEVQDRSETAFAEQATSPSAQPSARPEVHGAIGAASDLEDCSSHAASSDFASSDMLKPLRDKGVHVTLDSAFQFLDCSQDFATMFTSLLKGCSFFTCISDDSQSESFGRSRCVDRIQNSRSKGRQLH